MRNDGARLETMTLIEPQEKKGKFWANLSMFGKLPGFVGDAYWLGLLIDLVADIEEQDDILGLSYVAFSLGCTLSIYSTISAIYCEYRININAQNEHPDRKHTYKNLNWLQKIALFGYLLDQTGDKASAIGLVIHLIGADSWAKGTRIAVHLSATLFGSISSYAEFKTASTNLKKI